MTSKIEVPRELIDRMINALDDEGWHTLANEAAQVLAAPEAPRQEPVAWRYKKTWQKGFWAVSLVEPVAAFLLDEETHDIEPLYVAPLSPDHSGGGAGMVLLDVSAERNAMQRQRDSAAAQLKRECDDTDAALRLFDINPDDFRTDAGFLNLSKLRLAIVTPNNCRQRLAAEGKPYPRSSCDACGSLAPKWRECDAAIDKVKELNQ